MSHDFFLGIKKLTSKRIIRKAASHNLREMYRYITPPKSIDSSKSNLNIILKGASTASGVEAYANQLMKNTGIIKIRANAVRCLEVVFSLPVDTQIDLHDYFSACVVWAGQYFSGQENILSAIVHLDQAHPHCHLLLLPIKDDRLKGSDMFGNKGTLFAMHQSFKKEVTSKYQLWVSANRATVANRRDWATQVVGTLKKRNDVVLSSQLWSLVRTSIERNPAPYHAALGLSVSL